MNPVNPAPPIATIPEGLNELLSNREKPWHQSQTLFDQVKNEPIINNHRKCKVLVGSPEHQFILAYFEHQKPSGYSIKKIIYVHNATQTMSFEAGLKIQEIEA